ncbi:MAG: asparagine synthase [Candidatus Scalindua rubra]|uniref:asparagine synthase (glutamine-hydrolyzing) n=1 Tax=Candidatus Scalindua rubra TaxID=1872076 RepID=A0A1E3XFZ6_9BACT|nr:MAG: asparagine synthase [Candidatus Scalindua rubra]
MSNEGIPNQCLYVDLKTWLPEQLYFTDSVSMAHSIENRLPFLDHELAEFAFSIPFDIKMKGIKLKHLLRSAVAPILPQEILKQKKLGAGSPFPVWVINEAEVKEMVMDTLSANNLKQNGFFNTSFVSKLIEDHLNLKTNNGYKLWSLLAFTKWHELYIQNSPVLSN